MYLFELVFLFFSDIYPGVELLGHIVVLFLFLIFFGVFLKIYLFYFWLHWVFVAAHGLFSSCRERGLLFVVVHRLLIAVASLVEEHGL